VKLATLDELQRLTAEGNRAAARQQAETVAAQQPLNAAAHLVLGMLYLDDGAVDAALNSLRRASFLEPGNPLVYFSLGRAWTLAGQPDRAKPALLDARRHLAAMADNDPVAGGGGMWAGELRHAVEAQLTSLSHAA
jgi:chemotaxis protein methyltransferase CheR